MRYQPSIGIMRKGATGHALRSTNVDRDTRNTMTPWRCTHWRWPLHYALRLDDQSSCPSTVRSIRHHATLVTVISFSCHTRANSHAYRNKHDAAVAPQWNEECPGSQRRKDVRDTSGPRRGDTITIRHTQAHRLSSFISMKEKTTSCRLAVQQECF